MEVAQKIKNRTIIWSQNPTSGYIPKKNWNWYPKEIYAPTHVHYSVIHNNHDMHQVSIDRWLDGKYMVYTGVLFSLKKREILLYVTTQMTCEHYTTWNEPVTEAHMLYNSTYMTYLKLSDS